MAAEGPGRVVYLDVLRGLAILFMIIDHAYDWWLDAAGQTTNLAKLTGFLGGLAAPIFLILVGIGLAFSTNQSMQKGKSKRAVVTHLVRRGAWIVLWGFMLIFWYFTQVIIQQIYLRQMCFR